MSSCEITKSEIRLILAFFQNSETMLILKIQFSFLVAFYFDMNFILQINDKKYDPTII